MPWSMPYSVSRPRRSSLDAVAMTMLAPAALASWMAARPTPPAPACTSTVSSPCRWPNSNRQSSAVPNSIGTPAASLDRQPVGDGVRRARRHRHQLGVAAGAHRRHDRLADGEAGDPGADLAHDPGGLVPDDVRAGRHHAAGAVEQVAALDAHRLDLDQQPAGPHLGVGHVDVLEDLGPSGVGVGSRFHGVTLRSDDVVQAVDRFDHEVEAATAEHGAFAADLGGVDVEQPVDLGVARAALAVPRSGADLDRVRLAASTSGRRPTGGVPWRPMMTTGRSLPSVGSSSNGTHVHTTSPGSGSPSRCGVYSMRTPASTGRVGGSRRRRVRPVLRSAWRSVASIRRGRSSHRPIGPT